MSEKPRSRRRIKMLKLMYITNVPEIASIADRAGVDRIFIDLERYGKEERQKTGIP